MSLIKRPASRFTNSDVFQALAAGEADEPSGVVQTARWNVAVGGWTAPAATADAIDLNAELSGQGSAERVGNCDDGRILFACNVFCVLGAHDTGTDDSDTESMSDHG